MSAAPASKSVRHRIAVNLAATLLAGVWTPAALMERTEQLLGRRTRQAQRALIDELLRSAPTEYPPSPAWLTAFLFASAQFDRAAHPERPAPPALTPVLEPARFAPVERLAGLKIPTLATSGELADWLEVLPTRLEWLADVRRVHGRTENPRLRNYSYRCIPKANGAPRLLEAPKRQLKAIQRRILHEILDQVPVHPAAHGYVPGRSCLGGAQKHAGEFLVLTVDLQGFFPQIPASRVHAIFRSLGYPWAVARLLTGLCTTCTPASVFLRESEHRQAGWRERQLLRSPHLPQGAPSSPALANLAAAGLDRRLAGLASRFDAHYSRYADDLAFSGDRAFARRAARFLLAVEVIAEDERFRLNPAKTRWMRSSSRQAVTGIVVNDHCNVSRAVFDQLKAILHNCITEGPASQNRHAVPDFCRHLEARVAWVEHVNPARGMKLRGLFERVDWRPSETSAH